MQQGLTIPELLTDPLIRLLLKADGISLEEFADIVDVAAARLGRSPLGSDLRELRRAGCDGGTGRFDQASDRKELECV